MPESGTPHLLEKTKSICHPEAHLNELNQFAVLIYIHTNAYHLHTTIL